MNRQGKICIRVYPTQMTYITSLSHAIVKQTVVVTRTQKSRDFKRIILKYSPSRTVFFYSRKIISPKPQSRNE